MRITILLILLSLTASMSTASAEEAYEGGVDVTAYCSEQAELAGIEDATELSQYVQECVDIYAMPEAEQQ